MQADNLTTLCQKETRSSIKGQSFSPPSSSSTSTSTTTSTSTSVTEEGADKMVEEEMRDDSQGAMEEDDEDPVGTNSGVVRGDKSGRLGGVKRKAKKQRRF